MSGGLVFANSRSLSWGLWAQPSSFAQLGEPGTVGSASDKVANMLAKIEEVGRHFWIHHHNRTLDTSPGGLFNEWGPSSDIIDYPNSNLPPPKKGNNRFWEKAPEIQDPTVLSTGVSKSINSAALSLVDIQARDARFILLMTEAGWASHMQLFFIKQLTFKKEEGKYPLALYLSLEDIITTIFNFYAGKHQFLESPDDIAHQATFLELIQDNIRDRMTQYYVNNPAGRNIEKRVQSLGDALYGFMTARPTITEKERKKRLEKYGTYLGKNSDGRLSPFELYILRTIKEIEQIVASAEGEIAKRNALNTNLSTQTASSQKNTPFAANYNPRLLEVLSFLKSNFTDLKYDKGELYKISIGLFNLSKSIRSAAQPQKIASTRTPFWSAILTRIQRILPKK